MSNELRTPAPGVSREEGLALGGLVALVVITAAWWALALWPVADSPEWLVRTRAVCFGVNESGLPDGGGWVGLIGGPLGMLTLLLFGWADGVRLVLQRARRSRLVFSTLALLALSCVFLMTGAALRVRAASASGIDTDAGDVLPPASYPRLNTPTPALALVAQHGERVELAQLRGRPVLVTFAYAHCTTVCPVVVDQTLRAQATLSAAGIAAAVLIVTLDPWRDTPSRLPALAQSWGLPAQDAWVLSGSVEEVESVLDAWQVPRERDAASGMVTHPALVYVVDGKGRIAFASNGGAAALVELVRRL